MLSSTDVTQSVQDNPEVSTPSSKCEWMREQESTMIEYLTKTQRNNKSNKGFTQATWSSIATELKGTEGASKIKTGDMVHAHFNVVSLSLICLFIPSTLS
jgi:predicted Abi (CAAX) family protease